MTPFIDIAAFLLADNCDLDIIKASETTNDSRIVSKTPVTVNLDEICEHRGKKIH